MPAGFENRLGDNYRLLLAIADLAGGEWPQRARQAAQRLSGTADTTSAGTRLLAAIRAASIKLWAAISAPPNWWGS